MMMKGKRAMNWKNYDGKRGGIAGEDRKGGKIEGERRVEGGKIEGFLSICPFAVKGFVDLSIFSDSSCRFV
jgi:hypothetical protein